MDDRRLKNFVSLEKEKFGLWRLALMLFILLIGIRPVQGQTSNSSIPPDMLDQVGIEQKLDEQVPLDLRFRDQSGREVELGDLFRDKPVILSLVYYECPMLCTMILNGLLQSLTTLNFDVGQEFDVITVSFDPRETAELALKKKRTYIHRYDREGAEEGWHFLTGDETEIKKLTDAVGFNYAFDPETEQYVHASGIMVITPEGKLSRYFYGIEYPARDLRLGLIEASENRIGSAVDQVLLYCYHYDPTTGKYGVVVMNVIRLLGTVTVVILVSFIVVMLVRDRKSKRKIKNSKPVVS